MPLPPTGVCGRTDGAHAALIRENLVSQSCNLLLRDVVGVLGDPVPIHSPGTTNFAPSPDSVPVHVAVGVARLEASIYTTLNTARLAARILEFLSPPFLQAAGAESVAALRPAGLLANITRFEAADPLALKLPTSASSTWFTSLIATSATGEDPVSTLGLCTNVDAITTADFRRRLHHPVDAARTATPLRHPASGRIVKTDTAPLAWFGWPMQSTGYGVTPSLLRSSVHQHVVCGGMNNATKIAERDLRIAVKTNACTLGHVTPFIRRWDRSPRPWTAARGH